MTTEVQSGQTIYALGLALYGDAITGAQYLLEDNPELSSDTNLRAGQVIQVREGAAIRPDVLSYYQRDGRDPNTGQEEALGSFNEDFNDDYF